MALIAWLSACATKTSAPPPEPAPPPEAPAPPKPNIHPAPRHRPDVVIQPDTTPPKPRVAPPEVARERDWLGLRPTRVAALREAHPTWDGRGVLIGILDTGIDPSVPGLVTTSTGERKVLDLRDFSGEGSIALEELRPHGDSVTVGGRRLGGFGRVAALDADGPWWGGVLREIPLGDAPAADLDADGTVADTLAIVVVRASDGWALFADTDGDGSLANETAVRDYLAAGQTFGWAPRGRAAPVAVAANFADRTDRPGLDLFFDTSGHGTFVAGIAAGNDVYGVRDLDGVAPGAQLLGLKIANDAHGGISTTGSIARGIDYAIRFAERRRLPLVLNLSFGVGNEREGQARIDALVDSVLAARPELVLVVSAGNDGPGLSTLGFPASASRVLTVGATVPASFVPRAANDQIAAFSARGGELAKPDVIAPGVAYSTTPRYDTGDEIKEGTSFSSPHVTGLVAVLRSAAAQTNRTLDARTIRHALMITARPEHGVPFIEEGTGLPDIEAAWRWLESGRSAPDVEVTVPGRAGPGAAFRWRGLATPADTIQRFEITRPGGAKRVTFTLRSNADWLIAPRTVTAGGGTTLVSLRYRAPLIREPGLYTGTVSGWTADTLAGPAFRLVNTVVVPRAAASAEPIKSARLEPGGVRRAFVVADSARPFIVRVATWSGLQSAIAALHEPGGMPFRDGGQLQAGADSGAASFRVDGRDVVAGVYEADAVGLPFGGATVSMRVDHAPFRIFGEAQTDRVVALLENVGNAPVEAEVRLLLTGAERRDTIAARGGDIVLVPFTAPAWAARAVVDVTMDPRQWARFTDFGLSAIDADGRILAKHPLNYAIGRLQVPLPRGHGDMPLRLHLLPGLADPRSTEPWTVVATVRLYADSAISLNTGAGESHHLRLGPRESLAARFERSPAPWTLPGRSEPLGVVVALAGGEAWTREISLGPAAAR
ncbi:MAG TPA: S8 family serine peptidase [Gemmatimonadales bacterium]|jgi:subtilisin family serine protease|nr:S8 family serine peptidase [Gemmatimonadales bacterium]